MAYRFTAADRAAFKRCRRQWDFGARERQNLEPVAVPAGPDLDLAVRDALAVYYFPFSPIQVECAFEVNLPDPAGGDRELVLDEALVAAC
jgi:hypothetical protein